MIETWAYLVPFVMCLPNSENTTLYGDYYANEFTELALRLVRCTNKASCKNETEINDFIDANG